METYEKYHISIPNGKRSGEVQTLCPECSHTRKKKTDKCLSVNLDKNVWICWNCGWSGFLKPERIEREVFVKPVWKNKTELSTKLVKWFEGRGIKQETLIAMRVTEGVEFMPQANSEVNTIQFNYFWNGELLNVKYRDGKKRFKLHKGSELIFYNLDCLSTNKSVYIVEGEIDALTLVQCGIENVVSVPNGANPGNNNLQYVDNCIELFNHVEEIILATDNDTPGRKLRDDLARRFGIERCKFIESDQFKDLNEVMVKDGMVGVLNVLKTAKEFPMEGVFTISDMDLDIEDMYVNGLDRGEATGMEKLDEHVRFVKGYISIVTGKPGDGKSDFVDQVCLKLLLSAGWKTAYYSPENKPTKLHFAKMARKLVGKNWFGENRITPGELNQCKEFLNEKIWFVKPERDFTLKTILGHVLQLVKQKGISMFVIDAWNKLEHKYGASETKYVGESLDELAMFCEKHSVHCILVAHPTKLQKDKAGNYMIATLYDISGSANFFNKADLGFSIFRNRIEGQEGTEVYIQKVKFSHWGDTGMVNFQYDIPSGRFQHPVFPDYQSWLPKTDNPSDLFSRPLSDPKEFDSFAIKSVLPNERENDFIGDPNEPDPF